MIQQFYFCVFIQENKITNVKSYMHLYVYCSIIYKIWARYGSNLIVHPIDEQIKKYIVCMYAHVYTHIYMCVHVCVQDIYVCICYAYVCQRVYILLGLSTQGLETIVVRLMETIRCFNRNLGLSHSALLGSTRRFSCHQCG